MVTGTYPETTDINEAIHVGQMSVVGYRQAQNDATRPKSIDDWTRFSLEVYGGRFWREPETVGSHVYTHRRCPHIWNGDLQARRVTFLEIHFPQTILAMFSVGFCRCPLCPPRSFLSLACAERCRNPLNRQANHLLESPEATLAWDLSEPLPLAEASLSLSLPCFCMNSYHTSLPKKEHTVFVQYENCERHQHD